MAAVLDLSSVGLELPDDCERGCAVDGGPTAAGPMLQPAAGAIGTALAIGTAKPPAALHMLKECAVAGCTAAIVAPHCTLTGRPVFANPSPPVLDEADVEPIVGPWCASGSAVEKSARYCSLLVTSPTSLLFHGRPFSMNRVNPLPCVSQAAYVPSMGVLNGFPQRRFL